MGHQGWTQNHRRNHHLWNTEGWQQWYRIEQKQQLGHCKWANLSWHVRQVSPACSARENMFGGVWQHQRERRRVYWTACVPVAWRGKGEQHPWRGESNILAGQGNKGEGEQHTKGLVEALFVLLWRNKLSGVLLGGGGNYWKKWNCVRLRQYNGGIFLGRSEMTELWNLTQSFWTALLT